MYIPFNNTYVTLPVEFFSKLNPTPVTKPELIQYNHDLSDELGLSVSDSDAEDLIGIFSGNKIAIGSEPLAMVYAGHQFGGFSPQLGDGRANLLGEVVGKDGIRYDIQLKGSGPTPYSRGGDGRSALGPVIREYLVSEAMARLNVPTTRALAAMTTGEEVARDKLVAGGILTRVAKGFVRVGTFEFFSARRDDAAIKKLADYEIERHYPNAKKSANPYAAFLAEVVDAQAKLIAQWMALGFIHGVMNTDNMSITGETIDYGPCAFMDEFSYAKVFSSIDHGKRYAYNNQPNIGQWNLIRLAEALLPLFVDEELKENKQGEAAVNVAQDILNSYQGQYKAYWLSGMRKKIGLFENQDDDAILMHELLDLMEENSADFTLTFYYLSQLKMAKSDADKTLESLFLDATELNKWLSKWRVRLATESLTDTERQEKMLTVNPVYIPRNHQIEAAIRAAEDHNDFSVFHALNDVLKKPFNVQNGKDKYMLPPLSEEVVHKTFCGT